MKISIETKIIFHSTKRNKTKTRINFKTYLWLATVSFIVGCIATCSWESCAGVACKIFYWRLFVLFSILHPDKPALEIGSLYSALRDSLVRCELFVARVLQFQFAVDHPHKVWRLEYYKAYIEYIECIYWVLFINEDVCLQSHIDMILNFANLSSLNW
jgi:hypothetical protein